MRHEKIASLAALPNRAADTAEENGDYRQFRDSSCSGLFVNIGGIINGKPFFGFEASR